MTTTRRRSLLVLTAALLGSGALALAGSGHLLRLSPAEGTTYRYAMNQNQVVETQMGAMGSQTVNNDMRMEVSQKVAASRDDGSVDLEVTYDRVVLSMDAGPAMSMRYDSADGGSAGDPGLASLGALVGKTLIVTMSDRNEVQKIAGFEAIVDAMAADSAGDPAMAQVQEMLKKSFGEDSMKSLMQAGSAVFPEEPVSAGASWTHSSSAANPIFGELTTSSSYVLEAAEEKAGRDCHRIGVAVELSMDGAPGILDQLRQTFAAQGADVEMNVEFGDAKGSGTAWVDRADGMLVASELDMQMAINIAMTMAMPQAPEPMTMNMAMDMDQKVSLERLP